MVQAETYPLRFGPFTLLRLLGAGGMGKAYLARHPGWPGLLVVKRMHAHFLEDKTSFKRFVHEAKVASFVRHPSVAAMVAMGTTGKEPFFATEYVFGLAGIEILDSLVKVRARAPLAVGLYLCLDLLKGVEAIHDAVDTETGEPLGLIHRDVGMRNVLVGFDGGLRIIDLGLGKSMLADWHTATNVIAGSPDYMPPEQAVGKRVDRRADVYATAVVAWEILTGKKRIDEANLARRIARAVQARPEPLSEHCPEASKELEAALMEAMASDAEDRMPQIKGLLEAVERELVRVAPSTQRADVVAWLDEAFGEIKTQRSRELADVSTPSDEDETEEPGDQTQILAAQPAIFQRAPGASRPMSHDLSASAPKPEAMGALAGALEKLQQLGARVRSALVEVWRELRAQRSATQAAFLSMFALVVVLFGAVVLGPSDQPSPRPVERPRIVVKDEPPPPPPPPPPPTPTVEATPIEAPIETPTEAPTDLDAALEPPLVAPGSPVAPDLAAQKRSLSERMKRLRRVRFDVDFQRQLTRLGQQLTRAKTTAELDEIAGKLRRLERM
ncbi:MAG: serine/threonine protein kinase [Deltaproteobacteria bacterium]|nr:serine/threonine protein kinase [Deltaproteobacteria bacterium]